MFKELKALIAAACLLVVLSVAGWLYWRGSHNATAKADLRTAREVIKVERAATVVAQAIETRVNTESAQTARTAQEATREIDGIRHRQPVSRPTQNVEHCPAGAPDGASDSGGDTARILQLAREAREAARASGARLQSARTGAR